MNRPPECLGNYRILECLGEGGMGSVYKAFDSELGREVAIKWLKQATPASMERLQREAYLHARVEHPAVLRIYQVGEHEGTPFLVMQLIHGRTLDRVAPELDLEAKLHLMIHVADGIHATHCQNLIHRDLKPLNILVEEGTQRPYIMDFGLASDSTWSTHAEGGFLMGSPAYMAPEQIRGTPVDIRTDVYGLGATLFELLTGRPPFLGGSTEEICAQIQTCEAPRLRSLNPELNRDLETILESCLSKNPALRYASAALLRDDLQHVLEGAPIQARRRSLTERGLEWLRRNPITTLLGALLVISTLVSTTLWVRTQHRARIQADWSLRFGQETQRMEEVLRFGRMLPLHDVSGELAQVRLQMDRIRAQMSQEPLSRGPGHVALGEGYLFLQQPDLARQELEAAWKEGYRPAELSLALGHCFALLHEKAREEHLNILDVQERKKALERDRRELQEPAVQHLKQARKNLGSLPALVELQLALVEERWEDVASQSRVIQKQEPWNSEPMKQLARAYLAKGIRKSTSRDLSGYRQDLESALQAIEQGLAVSPSDEGLLGILYSVRWSGFNMQLQGLDRRTSLLKTIEVCERAAALNIQRLMWLNEEAMVLITIATDCVFHKNEDPMPWFQRAERILDDAMRQPPERVSPGFRARAFELEEYMLSSQASYKLIRKEDVKPLVDRGIHISDLAHAEGKPNYLFYGALADLCQTWAQQRHERGENPDEALALSLGYYRKAMQLDAEVYQLMALVMGLNYRVRLDLERGQDPSSSLEEADRIIEDVRKKAPELVMMFQGETDTFLLKAQWVLQQKRDPLPALLQARDCLEHALRLYPDDVILLSLAARCHANLASVRLTREEDPVLDAQQALKFGHKVLVENLYFPIEPAEVKAAVRQAQSILRDAARRKQETHRRRFIAE